MAVNQFTNYGTEGDAGKDVSWPVGPGADPGVGDSAGEGSEYEAGGWAAASGRSGEGDGYRTV